jgi:glycosyltransferase EpsJ
MLIDVILPVYNKARLLPGILSDLSYLNPDVFHVYLIDDGSVDDSAGVIQKYIKINDLKNFTFLKKENGGVSSARNQGLEVSGCKYVWFCDPDDRINSKPANQIGDILKSYLADIYIFSYETQSMNGSLSSVHMDCKTITSGSEYIIANNYFKDRVGLSDLSPVWNKIYKRDLIGDLRFDEKIHIGEDLLFNLEYLMKSTDVKCFNLKIYIYRKFNYSTLSNMVDLAYIEELTMVGRRHLQVLKNLDELSCVDIKKHIYKIIRLYARVDGGSVKARNFYVQEKRKYGMEYKCLTAREFIIQLLVRVYLYVPILKLKKL